MNAYKELKKGIITTAFGKYSNYIIQFGLMAILSRILTPSEFGIVAIVNVFLIFFNLLIDMGIGPAIIQNKELQGYQINSISSFTLILSAVLSAFFALLAKPISLFYQNSNLTGVCLFMSLALFTSGLNIVPQAVLLKQKEFIILNAAQVASSFLAGFIGILLALNHFSYYSLVINVIIKNLLLYLFIFHHAKIKNKFKINPSDLKPIFTFAKNQFLFNFINFFSRNLDNILIGKFMSPQSLAYYDKAYTLSLYPNQILTSVITPAIQPILSEYERQKVIIKETYLLISRLLALVGMPLTIFLLFSSKDVIYILFGAQWNGSVLTFQILATSIWIQMIASSFGAIFQSANRTDLLLLSGVLSSVLNISGILFGVYFGKIEYVAIILVISFSINFIQSNYLLMNKVFKSKQIEFYKGLLDPILVTVPILISMLLFQYFESGLDWLLSFVAKIIITLILFILGLKMTGNLQFIAQTVITRKKMYK